MLISILEQSDSQLVLLHLSVYLLYVFLFSLLARYILGARSFNIGMYVILFFFIVMTFPSFDIPFLNVLLGFVVLTIMYLLTYNFSHWIRKFVFHYMAMLATLIFFLETLLLVFLNYYYNYFFQGMETRIFIPNILFSSIVLVPIVENFLNNQVLNGFKKSFRLFIYTTTMSSLSSVIVLSDFFQGLVENYSPFLLVSGVLLMVLVGRYTGFRLTEYVRFWPIISKKISDA